jgi:hypothetical protein
VLEALRRHSSQRARSSMATHITNAGELLARHYDSLRKAAGSNEARPGRVNSIGFDDQLTSRPAALGR